MNLRLVFIIAPIILTARVFGIDGIDGIEGTDQMWWNSIHRIMCDNQNGYPIEISDQKLAQLEAHCRLSRQEKGPVSTCASVAIESHRDLLKAFCDPKTFSCVKGKPLLSEDDLQWAEEPDILKQELVDCIDNVMKHHSYLLDETINFI